LAARTNSGSFATLTAIRLIVAGLFTIRTALREASARAVDHDEASVEFFNRPR
jgi:hypothetical protein